MAGLESVPVRRASRRRNSLPSKEVSDSLQAAGPQLSPRAFILGIERAQPVLGCGDVMLKSGKSEQPECCQDAERAGERLGDRAEGVVKNVRLDHRFRN